MVCFFGPEGGPENDIPARSAATLFTCRSRHSNSLFSPRPRRRFGDTRIPCLEGASELTQATEYLKSLGIAAGLGLLVGLERESEDNPMAGIRTFPLFALLGGLCAILAETHGGWILGAGALACTALLVVANIGRRRESGGGHVGLTTEAAVLVVFAVGAAAAMHFWMEATVCAGGVMVLLHAKETMHGWVDRFREGELREISKLVLIALVILPLLPNRDMGYLDVINPFEIWLMVALIMAISLAAYFALKFLGGKEGALLSGLLGGLISSTATTAGVSRRSKTAPDASMACAFIVMVATTVVFARVIAEIFVAAGENGRSMIWPIAIMLAWSAVVAGAMWFKGVGQAGAIEQDEAPSEFKAAILFALLYVAVLCGVAFAKEKLGQSGLYAVAAISGLTDMDAITLSTSRLVADGHLEAPQGWRVILLGGVSNMIFKAGMVLVLGARRMLWPVLITFGATAAGAAVLWVVWPG